MIFKVLSEEEDKFNRTIDQGLAILADMEEDMKKAGEKTLSGDNAFKLYDTYYTAVQAKTALIRK